MLCSYYNKVLLILMEIFLEFFILISSIITFDRYSLYKQNLFEVLNHF